MAKTAAKSRLKEGQAIARLADTPLRPIYLLHGREQYFIRKCIRVIKKRLLASPDMQDVLSYSFYGSATQAEEILAVAQAPSFFQERQLILVREADKLKAPCQKKILAYMEAPSPEACVVFVAGEKLHAKNAMFNALKKMGPDACLGFPGLKKDQRKKWVLAIAEEKGLKSRLTPVMLSSFLDESTLPLDTVATRLEILSLYLQDGNDPRETGDPLPPEWSEAPLEQGYLLTDALLRGAEKESLVLMHRYVEQGTHPILILSRITWEMRRLARIQEARGRGVPVEDVIRSLRIPPFKQNFYLRLAGRIPEHVMREIFFSLQAKDRALKSSKLNLTWHLEELCTQILRAVTAA